MNYEVNFEKAKNQIRISDFALSNGYSTDTKKSTRKHLILRHSDGEKVCIFNHKASGRELYFVLNSDEVGDLILFVKNRLDKFGGNPSQNEWQQVASILSNKSPNIRHYSVDLELEKTSTHIFRLSFYNARKLDDFEYLQKRGLNKDMLQSQKFVGRIFNNTYQSKTNVLFPCFHGEEIRGVSIRGEGVKVNGKNSDLTHSLWHTNYDKSNPIEAIVVGESPIDVLSYMQLKYYEKGKNKFENANILGISIDGSVREYLHYFVRALPKDYDARIILVNDNDVPGYLHDIKIAKKIDNNFPIEPVYINLKSPELSFKQIYSNGLEHVYTIKNDRDSIKDFVSQFKGLLSKRKIEIDKPIGFKDWNGLLMGREAHTDIEIVPGKKKGI